MVTLISPMCMSIITVTLFKWEKINHVIASMVKNILIVIQPKFVNNAYSHCPTHATSSSVQFLARVT